MAKIELLDEQPLNITMSEPQTINETIAPQENINVETTEGWYEKNYTETDPIYSRSAAATITTQDIESWDNKSDFSGDYNDLENKPELFSGDYDDLENKPDIPAKTSDLINDSDFLTEHQDISGKVDKVNGKGLSTNDFTDTYKDNVDSNTTARHTHSNKSVLDDISSSDVSNWDSKQETLVSGTNIKTINNESILGSGNITIQGGGTGNGDMLKSVYDTDDNGIVDNAEKVNNHTVEKDVPSNAKFTDTVYDDTNIRQTLDSKADSSDIPTKTSDLTNDSGFITDSKVVVIEYGEDIKYSTVLNYLHNGYSVFCKCYIDFDMHFANDFQYIPAIWESNDYDIITFSCMTSNDDGETVFRNIHLEYQEENGVETYGYWSNGDEQFQEKLISGVNIKTINNQSILGSGNIDVASTETDPVFSASASAGITSTDITNWNNKSTFSGSYNDLTNKPTIPDELSDLSDDSTHRLVTDTEKSTWNAKSDFSGSYTDLTDKPTIPTIGNAKTYYGTSDTSASTAAKVVTCSDFVLETGATVFVKFTNANTYNGTSTLNVNSTGAKDIARVGTTKTTRYYWTAGEVVGFVYDGTNYVMIDKGTATTSYYGMTKLSSSTTSTSEALAATPKAVKTAYDLANSKQDEITNTNKLDYSLIDNTPTIPTIPSNLSSFTDDLGSSPIHTHSQYLTSHQDISGKVDKETGKGLSSNDFTTTYKNNVDSNTSARHTHSNKTVLDGISSSDITNWNNKSTFSGDYDDLTNKPTIPSKTSDITNDSGFIDNTYHDSLKQNTLVSGTNIKTINNQSILGNGDISFETIQEISGESSIRIKNLDTGIYRIYGGAYGCDVYYNSTGSLFIPSSYAYLIVTVEDDLQTVRHWVCIGNKPNEVCYGYSWLSYGYCYNVTSAEEQAAITGILSNLTTTAKTNLVSAINELDSDKQDTLVSGTNIKTINNQSILGSGNISLPTSSDIPTKTSDLINDSGFITGIKDVIGVSKTSATTNYPTNKQGFLPFISTGNYSIDARIGTDLTWTTKSVSFEDMTGTTYGISIPSGVSLVKVETNVRYQNPASSQININTMIFRDRNGTSTSARAMSQSVPSSSRYTCNFATYISVQEGDFIYIGSWKSTASANVSVSEVDNATGIMLEVIQ